MEILTCVCVEIQAYYIQYTYKMLSPIRYMLRNLIASWFRPWKLEAASYFREHFSCENYFDNQLNAQFLYSITICMLQYNSRHVSSINMPVFRRTNCIITASGIVTLCKRLYSMSVESRLLCSLLSTGVLCNRLQRATIPDAVWIQLVLLKMGMLMFETCRG